MIHVALGEIENTYRAAFLAMGFARGAANDAARMLVWLDVQGANGLARLVPRLDRLQAPGRPPQVTREAGAVTVDARHASILAIGPAATDLGIAEHRGHGRSRLRLLNATDVDLAGSLARLLLVRRCDAVLRWGPFEPGGWGELRIASGCLESPSQAWRQSTDILSPSVVEITFSGPPAKPVSATAGAALPNGLEVDPGDWQALVRVASRMLVPESEKSRQEGAGIGADED